MCPVVIKVFLGYLTITKHNNVISSQIVKERNLDLSIIGFSLGQRGDLSDIGKWVYSNSLVGFRLINFYYQIKMHLYRYFDMLIPKSIINDFSMPQYFWG